MRQRENNYRGLAFSFGAMLSVASLLLPAAGAIVAVDRQTPAQEKKMDQRVPPPPAFEKGVKGYVKLRADEEGKLPKLSKESKPAEIEAHEVKLAESVKAARAGVKQGNVFTPEVAAFFRRTMKREFHGERLRELREVVLEAETKGVPIRVNVPYPETKEMAQTPPNLLLVLPELPKEIKYRFVGRHLLLVDRVSRLIVDYALNVLP
jgi:hypothetical protein